MKRRHFAALTTALAIGAIGTGPASAQATRTVKLGFATVLSGAQGHYGKGMEYAARIAIDEANARKLQIGGQPVKFELLVEDDQADPKAGAAAAQRLADARVTAVIGHFNSGTSIPASRIYYAAGIPQISPAATNPQLTSQGYKSVFRTINTDAQLGFYAGKYAVTELKAQRIAVVDDRTAFGQGMADEFKKSVRAAKGNIVAHEYTTDKSVDFNAILTRFKGKNVDLVFFGGLDPQAGPMARQMKQLQMKAVLMGGGGFTNKNFISSAGAGAEGSLSWDYGMPVSKMPGGRALVEKMKAKYNVTPDLFAPFTYDATWVVINALVKANSTDPKVFLPVLAATNYDGVTGNMQFDKKGDLLNAPATLFEVKGGEWAPLRTVTGM